MKIINIIPIDMKNCQTDLNNKILYYLYPELVYLKPVSNNKRNQNNKYYINLYSNCTESIKIKTKYLNYLL